MPYYPTLAEDVARAKEILAKGQPDPTDMPEELRALVGGTIDGADTYAAYKLLESFVEVIEAVDPKVCELALRHRKRTDVPEPPRIMGGPYTMEVTDECVCRTRGCGHAARLHVGGICQACACDGWR